MPAPSMCCILSGTQKAGSLQEIWCNPGIQISFTVDAGRGQSGGGGAGRRFEELRNERTAKYQGMNLYIKNLVDEVDDDKLRAEFEPHGTITSAKARTAPRGWAHCGCHACLATPCAAGGTDDALLLGRHERDSRFRTEGRSSSVATFTQHLNCCAGGLR